MTKSFTTAAILQLRDGGPFVAENALHGRWRMHCAKGDIAVSITLALPEPATVHYLDVRPTPREESLAPAPACR